MMQSMARILLSEDDKNLGSLLKDYLQVKGHDVHLATDGDYAWESFSHKDFDICILDVMMPKKDGFTLAKDIRNVNKSIPILFLTARDGLEDKIEGFSLGGDDYLTKPFSMEELQLRIGALMRRGGQESEIVQENTDEFTIGEYHFHYPTRSLSLGDDSKRLTSRESELLRLLCMHKNQVLKRETALKLIWGDDSYFNARSMDVFITKLRKYLKSDEHIEIMNVHGEGYKLLVME